MEREKNMTTGRPLRLIVTFAVPLMIGGIGQQLYTLVDSAVVGRGVGVAGLAAVGATDWTYWVFLLRSFQDVEANHVLTRLGRYTGPFLAYLIIGNIKGPSSYGGLCWRFSLFMIELICKKQVRSTR